MIVDELRKSILKEAFTNGFAKKTNFESKNFKEIFNITNGFTPSRLDKSLWSDEEINWFTVEDYNMQGCLINYTNQHISRKALGKNLNRLLPKGTVILCCTSATIGTTAICNVPMVTNQQFNGLVVKKEIEILPKYIYYFILTLKNKMKNSSTSTTFPFLSVKNLEKYIFPLTSLKEQQRIVDKIEELFAKLDEIKSIEEELNIIKSNFPNEMKKSLILSALSGKMTYQRNDEKSDIRQIKPKFQVLETYPIPSNWKWFSHNDLFEIIGGSQPPKSKFFNTISDGFVQLFQIRDYGPNPQPVYVDKKDVSKFTKKGDIILARYGGSLGKVFWAEEGAYNVALAKVVLKYPSLINIKYLYYYYLSDLYQSKVKNGNRSAQAGFSKGDLNDLPFPLPPIEEQQRIVDKLEKLLPLCDDIETIINNC